MYIGGDDMKGYQLKITLKETTPPIWRRILIPADYSFEMLHDTIQTIFGWQDHHDYDFLITKKRIRIIDSEELDQYDSDSNKLITCDHNLATHLEEGLSFIYTYDYDDHWRHAIVVEKEMEMEENYPILLKWKGDNLAEDCGDQDQYIRTKDILKDVTHPAYESIKKWIATQHIPFVEEYVKEQLRFINSYAYEEPILSQHIRKQLENTTESLQKELHNYTIKDIQTLILKTNKKRKFFCLNDLGIAINIQIYEDEAAFLQGVLQISDKMFFNLYANAFNLILSNNISPEVYAELQEAPCLLKKMRTGYLPSNIADNEAKQVIFDCECLILMLKKANSQHLVNTHKDDIMVATRHVDGSMEVTYENTKLYPSTTVIHLSEAQCSKMLLMPKSSHNLRIDLLTKPSNSHYINQEMDVFLVMEHDDFECCENLHRSSLISFEMMNKEVVEIVYALLEKHGRVKRIFVNNENMHIMLEGLCEDLHIPLVIEDFVTNVQLSLEKEASVEEDEVFEQLVNMKDEVLDVLINQFDEDNLEKLNALMDQVLDDHSQYEDEALDFRLPKRKKHFDA